MKQSDKAIFLNRVSYSESSLIISFFTLKHGLQKFIFQGGKKKAHALFPTSLCEITFYKRPDSELGKLTDATAYEMLFQIQMEPLKSTVAFFMADVLKQCVQSDHPDPHLFHFLEEEIKRLNESSDVSMFPLSFLLNLTIPLGIEPSLDPENKKYFYYEEGEFSDIQRVGELVAKNSSVELIQNLLRNDNSQEANRSQRQSALDTILKYYEIHVPKFDISNSLAIIKQVLE